MSANIIGRSADYIIVDDLARVPDEQRELERATVSQWQLVREITRVVTQQVLTPLDIYCTWLADLTTDEVRPDHTVEAT